MESFLPMTPHRVRNCTLCLFKQSVCVNASRYHAKDTHAYRFRLKIVGRLKLKRKMQHVRPYVVVGHDRL